jgi:hypothetical protein
MNPEMKMTKSPDPASHSEGPLRPNMTLEDELVELRKLFIDALSDKLKGNPTGSVLAVIERVLANAGMLGKLPTYEPPVDPETLPYRDDSPEEVAPGPSQSEAGGGVTRPVSINLPDLPFNPDGTPAAQDKPKRAEAWQPLESRPFVVD